MNIKMLKMAFAGLVLSVSGLANATLITLDSNDTGWYDDDGNHTTSNQNYIAGDSMFSGLHNNFSVFDLSGLGSNIISATLNFYNPANGYSSNDLNETFELFDVNTAIDSLLGGTGGVAAYTDLGSGTLFGSVVVDATSADSFVSVVLNANAIDELNNAIGLFAFGGSLLSVDDSNESLFASSHENYQPVQLIVETSEVPEPSTIALLALGLLGLASRRFKK